MKITIFAAPALLLLLASCLPAGEPNQIIVDGEAVLEFEPEVFSVTGVIRSSQTVRADTLAEIADQLSSVRQGLPELEGLETLKIETSEVTIEPVREANCLEQRRYRTAAACEIVAYHGVVVLGAEGSPVNVSGNAISLLSQLGAKSVTLKSYGLRDRTVAEQTVLAAAVGDARIKAENIATASGSSITRAVRIQYGTGFLGDQRHRYELAQDALSPDEDTIVVSANRVSPETELDLAPSPIKIRANVTAAFEIE